MKNNYDCKLRLLTPIFIGNGKEIYPFECELKNNMIYYYDLDKLLDSFTQEWQYNTMINIFTNKSQINRLNFNELYKRFNLEQNIEDFLLKTIKMPSDNLTNFSQFISHPNGKIYLPGSSIKGAIKNNFNSKEQFFVRDVEIIDPIIEFGRITKLGMSSINSNNNLNGYELLSDNQKFELFIKTDLEFNKMRDIINDKTKHRLENIAQIKCINSNQLIKRSIQAIYDEIDDKGIVLQIGRAGGRLCKSDDTKLTKTYTVYNNNLLGWVKIEKEN